MIVYVESNFILEIALGQTQAKAAESILQLAETGTIEIAFPGFALSEPFATITRRERDQDRLGKSLANMLHDLPTLLAAAAKREQDNLWSVVSRLVEVGTALETDAKCLKQALEYQKRFPLSLQDSIIYAAIINDLQIRPAEKAKCFVNSNYKDFGLPDIMTELNSYHCWYERSFGKGLNYIKQFASH